MKYIFVIFFIIFKSNLVHAKEKIAFIDLNYIINNSISGKSINIFINDKRKKKAEELKKIENEIRIDENSLIKKKNIIDEELYNTKVNEIRQRISNYKIQRQNFNNSMDELKMKYTNQLLEKLNPIIANYVDTNSITIVFPKKIVIFGKKSFDITLPILDLIDKSVQKINFNE